MNQKTSSQRKRVARMITSDEDEEIVSSQAELFADEEEVDEVVQVDLFTQARTQVEGQFIPKRTSKMQDEDDDGGDMTVAQDISTYNPKPDQQEVVKVRQAYASLNTELIQNRTQLLEQSGTEKMISLVATANSVMSKVHTTSEATLDSRFLSGIAQIGAEKVQKLPFGISDFSLSDYISLVKSSLSRLEPQLLSQGAHPDPWEVMGKKASIYWKGVTSCDFLCGPIAVTPKEKMERNRQKQEKEKSVLKEVESMSKEAFEEQAAVMSSAATSNNVIAVAQALNSFDGPVPFHAFISHPENFARSVENLFYCSFLVAEGRAALDINEDGEIWIRPLEHETEEDASCSSTEQSTVKPKHQNVFNFSIRQWQAALEKYQLDEPLIEF